MKQEIEQDPNTFADSSMFRIVAIEKSLITAHYLGREESMIL